MDDLQVQNVPTISRLEKKTYRFSFQGNGGTLFGIQIVNLLLIIVTLGIYYFWAKTRVRSYTWSQVDFCGDRLAYHGMGKEILIGWIKAVALFGIPFYILKNVPILTGAPLSVIITGSLASSLLIMFFIPVATVGARRYRLSRTSLRGIRFSFRGKWQEFAKIFFGSLPWMILTFGFYFPYFEMRCQDFLIEKGYFGNQKFSFYGEGKDLIKSFIIAALLAFPTFMLSLVWYFYTKKKYVWNHTSFSTASFKSTITFGGFIGLYLVNGLILILTLGLGAPWVKVRTMRYYLENLTLEGQVNFSKIVQEAQDSSAFGEEVGDFFALDFDLG
ncbi:MAG: YjgN family protein [Smithella sp.]